MALGIAEMVVGAAFVSIVSGAVGSLIGGRGKVSSDLCDERRSGCTAQVNLKLDHIVDVVKRIEDKVSKMSEE